MRIWQGTSCKGCEPRGWQLIYEAELVGGFQTGTSDARFRLSSAISQCRSWQLRAYSLDLDRYDDGCLSKGKIPGRGETPHLHRPWNYDESVHAARQALDADPFSQVRWPTRICSRVQYLKSGKHFHVAVAPNPETFLRIVNKWPGQEEAAGDSKVGLILTQGEHSFN
jgi:hypothetical protein